MIFVMSKWDLRYNSHFWYSMRKRGKTCYDFEPMTTITNCHEKRGVHLKSMGMNKVGGWVMWQTGANWGYLSRSPCPLRHQLRPQSATGCQQTTSQISPSDQTGFPKNSTVIFYVIMHLCDMRERKKIKINEGRYQNLHPLSTPAI